MPSLGFRSETLHAGHAGEPIAALVVFVAAGVLACSCWRWRGLSAVAGFYAAHLGGQMLRVWSGRTSVEAAEIPATSLGLFLLVLASFADAAGQRRMAGVCVGLLAGAVDVALRDAGFAYPAFAALALTIACFGIGGELRGRGRRRRAAPGQRARASRVTLGGT